MNRSAAAAGRWRSRTEAGAVPVVELGVVACLLLLLPVVPRGVADPVADAFLWLNVPVVGSLVAAVLLAVLAAALGAAQASRPTHADPAVGIRAGLRRGGRSGDRGRTHRRAQPGANAAAAPRWTAGHATVSAASPWPCGRRVQARSALQEGCATRHQPGGRAHHKSSEQSGSH